MSNKYAERARETDLEHEYKGEGTHCVCGELFDYEGSAAHGPCPVKFARALEQAALEAVEWERQRAVEICDLVLVRMIDREKCARAIRDSKTRYPSELRARLAELRPEQEGNNAKVS
jgi:hypothetical protein